MIENLPLYTPLSKYFTYGHVAYVLKAVLERLEELNVALLR